MSDSLSAPAVRPVDVVHVSASGAEHRVEVTAAEEPLEIRLAGTSFVVTMRTPGADEALATGFLLAERIIRNAGDLRALRHCTDTPNTGNVLDVSLDGEAATRVAALLDERRLVLATSACGVCGRRSIDDLMQAVPRVTSNMRVSRSLVSSLPARLRASQEVFDQTGGLHAAALFDQRGHLVAVAEDVGRHNAVDKVIGSQVLAGRLPLTEMILFVSGRTSFEIVQKAIMAGVPVVAAVSAPSSLAVELAAEAGVTLIGFVRADTFNIYACPERVEV